MDLLSFVLGGGYVLAGVMLGHALDSAVLSTIGKRVGGSYLASAVVLVAWPVVYTIALAVTDDLRP